MRFFKTAIVLLFIVAVGLYANGSKETREALAGGVSFTESRGKVITLDGSAERVVTFEGSIIPTIYAMAGGTNPLIGAPEHSIEKIRRPVMENYFPNMGDADGSFMSGWYVPNIEALLSLNPDVVIQWNGGGDEKYYKPMEDVGLNVATLNWDNRQTIQDQITMIGGMFDNEELSKTILVWQNDTIQEIADAIEMTSKANWLSLGYLHYFDDRRKGFYNRQEDMFTIAGLTNVIAEQSGGGYTSDVSAEQILALDPDIIIIHSVDTTGVPSDIYNDPIFAGLKAVQNRRVYKGPIVENFSHMAPLKWMWLAMVAYPDLYTADIYQAFKDAYKLSYDIDISDEEVRSLLGYEANAGNSDYPSLMNGRR